VPFFRLQNPPSIPVWGYQPSFEEHAPAYWICFAYDHNLGMTTRRANDTGQYRPPRLSKSFFRHVFPPPPPSDREVRARGRRDRSPGKSPPRHLPPESSSVRDVGVDRRGEGGRSRILASRAGGGKADGGGGGFSELSKRGEKQGENPAQEGSCGDGPSQSGVRGRMCGWGSPFFFFVLFFVFTLQSPPPRSSQGRGRRVV